jgi:uncharacterized protein YndB with AHSA1/START domain
MTDHDVVEVRIRVAARPATVFKFLSEPDRVRQWMGDATFGTAIGDPIAVRYPDGSAAHGTIQELVPDTRVVFSWGYDNAAQGIPVGSTRVAIDLLPIPGGTLVTLSHSGIPHESKRREHAMGWRHYLSALANAATSVRTVGDAAVAGYHAAWAERDAAARVSALERCWASDAIFRDAMGYAEGRHELADYIGAAQRFAPDIAFERVGPLLYAHGYVNYRWRMTAPNGAVVMTGCNVGELSPEGQFLSMTGFWDQPATV